MQTEKSPNKPVTKSRRSRSVNGSPRPYRDGNRWKAPGFILEANGQRQKVMGTGATQAQAIKRRDELIVLRRQAMALESLPREVVYVDEYCKYWLDVSKQGKLRLANKTYVGYQSAIQKLITPFLGKVKLVDLNRQHIVSLMNQVLSQGFSKSIQNQIRAVLKPALEEAELEGYIEKSPWRSIKLSKTKSGMPDFFEIQEVIQILQTASDQGSLVKWQFCIVYGPRQGECLGLRWSDLDLDCETPSVTFSRQLQRVTGKGLIAVPLKTVNSYRTLALSKQMSELFKAAREAHRTAQMVSGPSWNPEGYVFVTPLGTPIDAANDRKAWMKLLDDAGVSKKPLHTARHTAATHASDLNISSKMLGHSSIRVTADFYAAAPREAMRESLENFEKQIEK